MGNTPPVAFGEDQGSQRSGATLVLRMWPMLRAVKRSRAYNATGLKQVLKTAFKILEIKRPQTVDSDIIELFPKFKSVVLWSPVLPRARVEVVDELVKRMGTTPPMISLRTALENLKDARDIDEEMDRIKEQMKEAQQSAMQVNQAKTQNIDGEQMKQNQDELDGESNPDSVSD